MFPYFSGCVGLVGDRLGCGGLVSLQSWTAKFGDLRSIGIVELFMCCLEGSLLLPLYFFVETGSVLTNLKVVGLNIRNHFGHFMANVTCVPSLPLSDTQ